MRKRLPAAALLAIAAFLVPASAQAKAKTTYYVSLGDSYATGYQRNGPNNAGQNTNQGYTDYLYAKLKQSHPGLKLLKLGCGGATTTSIINGEKPCDPTASVPYANTSRATSQLTYAAKWIKAHRARVHYVTISIGGNDFSNCPNAGDFNAILACTANGIETMKKNLPVIAKTLRRAAGKDPVIVGNTYPDVVLGEWIYSDDGKNLARASIPVFRDQLNPAMKSAYAKQKIGFVDATKNFGAYIPLEQTTFTPYGDIPIAVANICRYGWYCEFRDIHLKSGGYSKLATLYRAEIRRIEKKRKG